MAVDWIPILGDSMWPALRTGDRARLSALEHDPAVGEVVVVRINPGGGFIIHRVVRLDAQHVYLQGDNCSMEDPPISRGAILGGVDEILRAGRTLSRDEWDTGKQLLGTVRVRLWRRLSKHLRGLWRR